MESDGSCNLTIWRTQRTDDDGDLHARVSRGGSHLFQKTDGGNQSVAVISGVHFARW